MTPSIALRVPQIFRAIDEKDLKLIEFLIESQTSGVYYDSRSPIEYAMDVFPEAVPLLISYGKQIHFPNEKSGEYLIHCAVRQKNYSWIKLLLEKGCNPNVFDRDRNRPLHIAVQNHCSKQIVLLLIAFGGNPNAKNIFELTPICYSIQNGDKQMTALLLKNGTLLSRDLMELKRAVLFKKFNTALEVIQYIDFKKFGEKLEHNSEPFLWFFVKYSVGEVESEEKEISEVMLRLVQMTSGVNHIDSVWGSLMHFLIYADHCTPTHSLKSLFQVLIRSNKCHINQEFQPKDTQTKTGQQVLKQQIKANGTALSFALELPNSNHYSEDLIRMGADLSTINWDNIYFAPEKVNSLKMLVLSGSPLPNDFREYADPSHDFEVEDNQIDYYIKEFNKFNQWLEKQKTTPLTLKQMARNTVRKTIGVDGCRRLDREGSHLFAPHFNKYPKELIDFLLFKSYEDFQ